MAKSQYISAPTISKSTEKNGIMTFTLENTNVSIANAIRRTILSDIDIVALKTFPYKDNLFTIHTNTTNFNNEIIRQRLNCIPVHIKDLDQSFEELEVEINEENTTESMRYITTKDFKIKNLKTNTYLNEKITKKIFPMNPITKEYILFLRLKPKVSQTIPGQKIHLTVKMSISNASIDGAFNVVSSCGYGNTGDVAKQNEEWNKKEDKMKEENSGQKLIDFQKENWFNHDCKRYFISNSFDFTLESIGIFTNGEILIKACDILLAKCDHFDNLFENDNIEIQKDTTRMDNCFDVILKNEDYTFGKILEYLLHEQYFQNDSTLIYVGFLKPHPHDTDSIIRIAFKDEKRANNENIKIIFKHVITIAKSMFENIKDYIK
jgi:DNA-directed RNA polymerase subunit L